MEKPVSLTKKSMDSNGCDFDRCFCECIQENNNVTKWAN